MAPENRGHAFEPIPDIGLRYPGPGMLPKATGPDPVSSPA